MTRDKAINKLISVRHHCFIAIKWEIEEPGNRAAFRTLNRLYVAFRDKEENKIQSEG